MFFFFLLGRYSDFLCNQYLLAFTDRETNWDVVVVPERPKETPPTKMIASGTGKETTTTNDNIGGNGGGGGGGRGPGKKSSKDVQKQLPDKLDSTSFAST